MTNYDTDTEQVRIAYLLRAAAYALETTGDLSREEVYEIIDECLTTAQTLYPLTEEEE
jgi:hypothetical protein